MGIRVYVTGRVAVEVDGQVVIDERRFRGKQGRLFFAYLVCERSRPVAKEELALVLWPEEQSDAWEAALSALTSRLAALLSSEGLEDLGMSFSRQFGQYQLKLPSDSWVDIEAGNSALDRAEAAVRNNEARNALDRPRWRHPSPAARSCPEWTVSGGKACRASWTANSSGRWTAWERCSWRSASSRRPRTPSSWTPTGSAPTEP